MVSAHPILYLQLVLVGAYFLARRFTSSFPKHGNVKEGKENDKRWLGRERKGHLLPSVFYRKKRVVESGFLFLQINQK